MLFTTHPDDILLKAWKAYFSSMCIIQLLSRLPWHIGSHVPTSRPRKSVLSLSYFTFFRQASSAGFVGLMLLTPSSLIFLIPSIIQPSCTRRRKRHSKTLMVLVP